MFSFFHRCCVVLFYLIFVLFQLYSTIIFVYVSCGVLSYGIISKYTNFDRPNVLHFMSAVFGVRDQQMLI